MKDIKNKEYYLTIIIILYLSSFFFKAFQGSGGIYGYHAFLFGFLSILINFIAFVSWLANLLFFIALYRTIKEFRTLHISAIAVLFAFLSIFVKELPIHMGSSDSTVNIGSGFYIWFSSICALFLLNLISINFKKKNTTSL